MIKISATDCFVIKRKFHVFVSANEELPSLCYLPKVRGNCRASHSRFYYNPTTNKCQIFLYGGCGGNDNNFAHPKQCENMCGGEPNFESERTSENNEGDVSTRSTSGTSLIFISYHK